MSNSPSPLEDIHDAINNSNPFSIKFVDQHHIWGASFPDVPEINAHVSDAVFDAIDQVSKHELPSIGIIITGEKGLGKTQVISRIRHRLQAEGNAFFIYMGNYGDLDSIKSEFLQTLTSSLKRIGVEGVTQWQELAANMVFTARGDRPCTPKELANGRFESIIRKNSKIPENWANAICTRKPELNNPYLVKAILWTLSENYAPYAISWLSGQELTQAKADELGLPNNSQKTELATFKTTCELLALIGHYSNLVFCFDELDDPNYSDRGFTRAQIVAALAKDLRNSISKCVLLMAMYPATLRDEIKLGQTQGASYDRTADKVLELDYLNSDTSVALVSKWLEDFYMSKELVPPHPLYPFDESEIRSIGSRENPPARALLKWCSENWKVLESSVVLPSPQTTDKEIEEIQPVLNPVKAAFENELEAIEQSIDEYLDDKKILSSSLWHGFASLIGQTVEGVRIDKLEEFTCSAAEKSYSPDFKIIGEEDGKPVKIGVMVHQIANGQGVQAGLKKLINYKKLDITRGCLIRSKTISPGAAKAQGFLRELLDEKGGEWVQLGKEDIKPLIAILSVFEKLENYEVSEEQVYEFINQNRLAIDNPLIREILSDPSGQEPSNLTDEDLPISIPTRDSDVVDIDTEEIAL
jgi:hypothetical protein